MSRRLDRTESMLRSINAWFFGSEVSPGEMAARCAAAGLEGLELTLDADGFLTPATEEPECRRISEQVRGHGIQICSLATALFWDVNYGSPDSTTRQMAIDLTLAMLDRAAWLGTDAILVVPAVVGRWNDPRPRVSYGDALNRTAEALHRLVPEAEQRGVVIGIENVWNRFLLSPVEMADVIDRANSPWVGVYFDVGNVMATGYPQDWIDVLGRRFVGVHLKDFDLGKGGAEGFCPLGEGDVDWKAVLRSLARSGYDGPLTFEGHGDLSDITSRIDRIMRAVTSA